MKLTPAEQAICDKYTKKWADGYIHCSECPLLVDPYDLLCYKNIDGRTKEAKQLKRY